MLKSLNWSPWHPEEIRGSPIGEHAQTNVCHKRLHCRPLNTSTEISGVTNSTPSHPVKSMRLNTYNHRIVNTGVPWCLWEAQHCIVSRVLTSVEDVAHHPFIHTYYYWFQQKNKYGSLFLWSQRGVIIILGFNHSQFEFAAGEIKFWEKKKGFVQQSF